MEQTKLWKVDSTEERLTTFPELVEAASLLKKDDVVAFPTETVYGLGANAYSSEAVMKIFEAKGRPSDNPLIIHISNKESINHVAEHVPQTAQTLIRHFWPGPLTVILPKKGPLSPLVTAGLDTVGIRMPNHPVALALIELAGVPLAAPSANRSGKPSPTKAMHVLNDLNGRIAGVVDGGETGIGVESTVVDCTTEPVTLLRPGGVTLEELKRVLGEVMVDPHLIKEKEAPRSPGMKYTHYAPEAPLLLIDSSDELQRVIDQEKKLGKKVGVLTTEENVDYYKNADRVLSCGRRSELATVAQKLYDVLREFDSLNVDLILSETFPNTGVGEAIMNRLSKASGGSKMNV